MSLNHSLSGDQIYFFLEVSFKFSRLDVSESKVLYTFFLAVRILGDTLASFPFLYLPIHCDVTFESLQQEGLVLYMWYVGSAECPSVIDPQRPM